jgi:hypothetical protein
MWDVTVQVLKALGGFYQLVAQLSACPPHYFPREDQWVHPLEQKYWC